MKSIHYVATVTNTYRQLIDEYYENGYIADYNKYYDMLKKAVSLINKGARFIGANPDITDPAPNGELIPAVGPILSAIETATGKKPYIVGKPNPVMMSIAFAFTIDIAKNIINTTTLFIGHITPIL